MKLLFLLVVGVILYFIARGYKTEDYHNIKIDAKQKLQGSLEEHEAGLLVALLAKVAKADGKVSELEAELLSNTFTDISVHFENSSEIREELKAIYVKEKESFDNTIDICQRFLKLTKRDYAKRLKVMEYLLNLAFIDNDFSQTEFMITEDIANSLEIKRADFETIINQFELFYKNRAEAEHFSTEKAYSVLGANRDETMSEIKKRYRKLVKEHHPDIIRGQGASQSIIDEATAKLQEINEAYEIVKKDKEK